jgi:hypothetical protein
MGRSTLRCLEHRLDPAPTVSTSLNPTDPTTQSSGLWNRRLGRDSPPHAVPQPLKIVVRTINGWIEKSSYHHTNDQG